MTVFQNVAYPLNVRHLKSSEIKERVPWILDLVGLQALQDRPATRLSGGQQQRVALARALVYSPQVLLLDEPLSSLDARLRDEMRHQIKQLQRQLGVTVIFVTHDQREAFSMSDHVAVLQLGKVAQLGTPQQVYVRPANTYVRDFLGRSLVLHGVIAELNGDTASVDIDQVEGRVQVPFPAESGNGYAAAFTPGARVKVTLRPEYLRVAGKEAAGRPGHLSAVVEDVLYLGEGHEYMVSLGDHSEVITLPGELRAARGEQLILELDPHAMTLWPE